MSFFFSALKWFHVGTCWYGYGSGFGKEETGKLLLITYYLFMYAWVYVSIRSILIADYDICKVPVIVASESYKFSDKVQLDSIVFNELGNGAEIASMQPASAVGSASGINSSGGGGSGGANAPGGGGGGGGGGSQGGAQVEGKGGAEGGGDKSDKADKSGGYCNSPMKRCINSIREYENFRKCIIIFELALAIVSVTTFSSTLKYY